MTVLLPYLLLEHPLLAADPVGQQIATVRQEGQHNACPATVQCRWRAHGLDTVYSQGLQQTSGRMQQEVVAEPRRKDCSGAFSAGAPDQHE